MPPWHAPAPEPLPDLRTLVLQARREGTARAPTCARDLERERPAGLPAEAPLVRRQGRAAGGVAHRRHRRACPTPSGARGAGRGRGRRLAGPHRALLPAAGRRGGGRGASARCAAQLALARLRQGRRVGFLTDAFADDRMPPAVLPALRAGAVAADATTARSASSPTSPACADIVAAERAGDPPALGRAIQQLADHRRAGGAQAHPPHQAGHPPGSRDDAAT